jgi:hypothetical protein
MAPPRPASTSGRPTRQHGSRPSQTNGALAVLRVPIIATKRRAPRNAVRRSPEGALTQPVRMRRWRKTLSWKLPAHLPQHGDEHSRIHRSAVCTNHGGGRFGGRVAASLMAIPPHGRCFHATPHPNGTGCRSSPARAWFCLLKWPHNCGSHGVVRAATMPVSTAVRPRSMVRMGQLWRPWLAGQGLRVLAGRRRTRPGWCFIRLRPFVAPLYGRPWRRLPVSEGGPCSCIAVPAGIWTVVLPAAR